MNDDFYDDFYDYDDDEDAEYAELLNDLLSLKPDFHGLPIDDPSAWCLNIFAGESRDLPAEFFVEHLPTGQHFAVLVRGDFVERVVPDCPSPIHLHSRPAES